MKFLFDKLSALNTDLEEGKQIKKERIELAISELDQLIARSAESDEHKFRLFREQTQELFG